MPSFKLVPPVYVLGPLKISVSGLVFTRLPGAPPSLMAPVKVPPCTVSAVVSRFTVPEPSKVMSATSVLNRLTTPSAVKRVAGERAEPACEFNVAPALTPPSKPESVPPAASVSDPAATVVAPV